VVNFFYQKSYIFIEHFGEFGIIIIATDVAEDGGQVAREKPIFWQNSQDFEHLNFCNSDLFSLPLNVVVRGI